MGRRNDQCRKVCRILDVVLANRPTERDSLIVAVRKAFDALEQAETNCSEIPNNSDTISRRQAINALRAMQTYKMFAGDDLLLIDQAGAQTELMMLPSIQPEYPKGRWIPTASEKGRHECSRCHEYAPCYQDGSEHLSTFCALCGAKMERGEQE